MTTLMPCPKTVWVDGIKQTTDPAEAIRTSVFREKMQAKLHSSGVLHADHFDLVDWDAIEDAQTFFPSGFSLWISKHVTGFCGVGKMMKYWAQWDDNNCPCCGAECETAQHVLVCNNETMVQEFSEALEVLEHWLIQKDTCPDIADCLVTTMANHAPRSFLMAADEVTHSAAEEQDCIGWTNLFEGKISRLWRKRQREYYKSVGSRKSARTWTHGLVRQLLEFTHRMWTRRNYIRHSTVPPDGAQVNVQAIDQQIREHFDWGLFSLAPSDHRMLTDRTLEEILNLPLMRRRTWLLNINAAGKSEDLRQRNENVAMRETLNDWLLPRITNEDGERSDEE